MYVCAFVIELILTCHSIQVLGFLLKTFKISDCVQLLKTIQIEKTSVFEGNLSKDGKSSGAWTTWSRASERFHRPAGTFRRRYGEHVQDTRYQPVTFKTLEESSLHTT